MGYRWEEGTQALERATSDHHVSCLIFYCDACMDDTDEEDLRKLGGNALCPTCFRAAWMEFVRDAALIVAVAVLIVLSMLLFIAG